MQTTSVSEQHQISRWESLLPIYQVFNLNENHRIAYNGTNQQSSLEILYALLAQSIKTFDSTYALRKLQTQPKGICNSHFDNVFFFICQIRQNFSNGVYKCLLKGFYFNLRPPFQSWGYLHSKDLQTFTSHFDNGVCKRVFSISKWGKILLHNHNEAYKYLWAYRPYIR